MKPDELKPLLSAYLDGELTDAERSAVDEALTRSPEARRMLDQLRRTVELVQGLPRRSLPNDFHQEVSNGIERSVLLREPRRRGARVWNVLRWTAVAGTAAAAVLVVAVVLNVYRWRQPAERTPVPAAREPVAKLDAETPDKPGALAGGARPAPTATPPGEESKKESLAFAARSRMESETKPRAAPEAGVLAKVASQPSDRAPAGAGGERVALRSKLGLGKALVRRATSGPSVEGESAGGVPTAGVPKDGVPEGEVSAGPSSARRPPVAMADRMRDAKKGAAPAPVRKLRTSAKAGAAWAGPPSQAFLNRKLARQLVVDNGIQAGDKVVVTRWNGTVPQVTVATVVDVARAANRVQMLLGSNNVVHVATSVVRTDPKGLARQTPFRQRPLGTPDPDAVAVQFYCEGDRSQLANVVMELSRQSDVVASCVLARPSPPTVSNVFSYQDTQRARTPAPRRGRTLKKAPAKHMAKIEPIPPGADAPVALARETQQDVPAPELAKKPAAPHTDRPSKDAATSDRRDSGLKRLGQVELGRAKSRAAEPAEAPDRVATRVAGRPDDRLSAGQAPARQNVTTQARRTQGELGETTATAVVRPKETRRRARRTPRPAVQQADIQPGPTQAVNGYTRQVSTQRRQAQRSRGRPATYQLLIVVESAVAKTKRAATESAPPAPATQGH